MGLEATLDTGPIYARTVTAIGEKYASELTSELAGLGASLLVEVLGQSPWPTPVPQGHGATYAAKLTSADFELDPSRGAAELARVVRAGRSTCHVAGRRLIVTRAHAEGATTNVGRVSASKSRVALGTPRGELVLDEVVPEGSSAMSATAWLAGARLVGGEPWSR
jgi:methionyl-tRNA formyltransferase